MAWEIYIQDLPQVASVADIPPSFRPGTIGLHSDLLRDSLREIPFAEQQDDWLFIRDPDIDVSAQFMFEDGGHVRSIVVHVHGGERGAACAAALVRASGQRALDTATGELFDMAAPEHSAEAWRAYCADRKGH